MLESIKNWFKNFGNNALSFLEVIATALTVIMAVLTVISQQVSTI